jgi:PAS domain S-box-containing protein
MGSTDMDLDYRLLFDLAPDPCLVLDRQFRMVAANRARLEATMTTLAELLGRSVFDLFPDNPQEAGATGVRNLRASLQRVLKTGMRDVMAVQRYDIPKPQAEGGGFEERYWSPINVPVPGTDGEVAYIIHRVQDVTEFVLAHGEERRPQVMEELRHRSVQMEAESYNSARETADINFRLKQANDQLELKNLELRELNRKLAREAEARVEAQEALHAANAELDRSNKNLELFASVASHDLQEPLHTITSYTELLGRRYGDRFDDRGRQYMSFILDGTHHMHRMINDLLAYSRVNTRARPFFSVDLNAALKQALTSLARGLDESKATIEQVELPQVEGDDLQLAQLFQNLLSNAVKFAKKDVPLVIRISCEGSGSEWLLGVHDNGIGIEPRFLNQIFEIFRRLHTRQEYEGTGIGLAICKRIVEHHGGRIWAESTFGEGASFFFTLPTRGTNHGQ